jgi:hypothetical protein
MATRRRFAAQRATIDRELKAILAKMGATSGRVDLDITERDTACTIAFDRSGKRYVFRCAKWAHPNDNYRAAQLTIVRLYQALEDYGTTREEADAAPLPTRQTKQREAETAFDHLFGAFLPPPDDKVLLLGDGTAPWWEALGVARDADRRAIENAYKALARVHHPDTGGSVDSFVRLRRAYEAGIAALRERGAA